MNKQLICSLALLGLLIVPTQSHAATDTKLETLGTQYRMLVDQLETLKAKRNASSTMPVKTHSSSTSGVKHSSTTVDRTCMGTAVATREAAVATAWGSFNTSLTAALTKRSASLSDYWNSSTSNRTTHKQIWSTWKSDKQAATNALKSVRKSAWDTFAATAKNTCKVTLPAEEKVDSASSDSTAI